MFYYFGYGSNINLVSLRAKGVVPVSSQKASLPAWRLRFNVQHWFYHEGGMGNIEPATSTDHVEGLVHLCHDKDLESLDAMESYGDAYDRIEIELETQTGVVKAWTYVGLPAYLDNSCLPTRRYLNIILNGAKAAGLSDTYLSALDRQQRFPESFYPEFRAPQHISKTYDAKSLAAHPHLTALSGFVFDMSEARSKLKIIAGLFGGRDMTLFILKRLDTSTGNETLDDVNNGRISPAGRKYLNAYLNEFDKEFRYAGRYVEDD